MNAKLKELLRVMELNSSTELYFVLDTWLDLRRYELRYCYKLENNQVAQNTICYGTLNQVYNAMLDFLQYRNIVRIADAQLEFNKRK